MGDISNALIASLFAEFKTAFVVERHVHHIVYKGCLRRNDEGPFLVWRRQRIVAIDTEERCRIDGLSDPLPLGCQKPDMPTLKVCRRWLSQETVRQNGQ